MIENNYDYLITLHGDNQGDVRDIIDIFNKNLFKNMIVCMELDPSNSKLINYSNIRILVLFI